MSSLLDLLQAASNSAASNVSAPVDAIAWLLKKAGIDVGTPVGGSDWMARQGLTRPVQQSGASLAGETAGLFAPIAAAAKAPQIARGLLQGAENMAAPRTLRPDQGAIVWHGSPHKFDRFDSSKIGTGEGAQAYGHGLYLAESPAVAGQYKEALSAPSLSVRGREVRTTAGTAMDTAKAWLDDVYERGFFNSKTANPFDQAIRDVQAAPVPGKEDVIQALQRLKAADATMGPGGSLYKVDLPDSAISRMLDWDKSLRQQAPEVQDLARRAGIVDPSGDVGGVIGKGLYEALGDGLVSPKTAEKLRKLGIPGIRYLDGGSRGAGTGTSNFVVFPGEESLLTILERNGVPLR